MGLAFENLCNPPQFCFVKVATLVASVTASVFLLATAATIIWKRVSKRPDTPIGRLVDNLVLGLCLLDSTYYLPCLLVVLQGPMTPVLMLSSAGHHGHVNFIYPHCREAVMMLDILFHCYVAHIMYCWIVLKHSVARLQKSFNPCLVTVLGLLLVALYVLLDNFFWRAYGVIGLAYGAIIVNLVVFPACVLFVLRCYFKTIGAIRMGAAEDSFVPERYLRTRRKLLLISAAMAVTWIVGPLADMVVWTYVLINDLGAAPTIFYPVRLITCRVIGIVDALILAGAFDMCCMAKLVPSTAPLVRAVSVLPLLRKESCDSEPPILTRENSRDTSTSGSDPSDVVLFEQGHPSRGYLKARIFVTSWNMSRASSTRLVSNASLPQWIPVDGYDIYVVVLQRSTSVDEVGRAVSRHLGGHGRYHMFSAECGDARLPDGVLAVLVWCRSEDVMRGGVQLLTMNPYYINVMKGQKNENVGRLGVSLRYYDSTIALIGVNFRMDMQGYNRVSQRNEDAKLALQDVFSIEKGSADTHHFDSHLKHHHTLLIGALNYRLTCLPEDVMEMLAESSREEANSYVASDTVKTNKSRHMAEIEREPLWHVMGYREKLFSPRPDEGPASCTATVPAASLALEAAALLPGASLKAAASGTFGETSSLKRLTANMKFCGFTGKPPAEKVSWQWVTDQDELLQCQLVERVLETFEEGPIRFPPTCKWRTDRGNYIDYREVDELKMAFNIGGKGHGAHRGASGERPEASHASSSSYYTPSYTDRILYHSLEDKSPLLNLLAYDMCESVHGSDHKPICAAFELLVDATCKADNEKALTYMEDYGMLYLCSVEICNLRFDVEEWNVNQLGKVTMGFPLVNEDLLAVERGKGTELEMMLEDVSLGGEVSTVVDNISQWPWIQDAGKMSRHYFQKVVVIMDGVAAAPWANQHVALKFTDGQGTCLGQGTFVLPKLTGAFRQRPPVIPEETKVESIPLEAPSLARGESFVVQEVRVPLSSAGTRQGSVEMEVRVRKIPLDKRLRTPSPPAVEEPHEGEQNDESDLDSIDSFPAETY